MFDSDTMVHLPHGSQPERPYSLLIKEGNGKHQPIVEKKKKDRRSEY